MRLAAAIGIIGLALSLAGGALAAAPTKASWTRAANAVCAATNAQIRALPTMTSEEVMISDVRRTGQIGAHTDVALAAIPKPATQRLLIDALLAKARTAGTLFRGPYLQALVRGDDAGVKRLSARLVKLGDDFNAMARRLGAHTCAVNPKPSGAPLTKA